MPSPEPNISTPLLFRLTGVQQQRRGPQGRVEFELLISEMEIRAGDKIGVASKSGTGKSTLVDLLVFAARPAAAERFEFFGADSRHVDIWKMWQRGRDHMLSAYRKQHIGVVLQTGGLLPFVSARRNIELPRKLLGLPDDGTVTDLAARLDISSLLDRLPGKLSVGERQRVAIARALAHKPTLVVADEPTASLDGENAEEVMKLFVELVEQLGLTLIVASHDTELLESKEFRILNHELHRNPDNGSVQAHFWTQAP